MDDILFSINQYLFRQSRDLRVRLWKKLATLLKNGVSLVEALDIIRSRRLQTSGENHPLVMAIDDWTAKLNNGATLFSAIEGWVDDDELMLIAAGERSGKVESALYSTIRVMTAKKTISKTLRSSLTYPAFLFVAAIVIILTFSYKLIPAFSKIIPYERWSGLAKLMIDVTDFVRSNLWLGGALLIIMVVAFFVSLPRWKDGLRTTFDRHVPYSIYRVLIGSSWMIAFSALVAAGVRTEKALEDLSSRANPWLQTRIDACLRHMRSGKDVGTSLALTGYEFPDAEIIDDLGVYARLSGFDDALAIIGNEWIDESVERIEAMGGVMFTVAIIFVGLVIGFMVAGMMVMELQMVTLMKSKYGS